MGERKDSRENDPFFPWLQAMYADCIRVRCIGRHLPSQLLFCPLLPARPPDILPFSSPVLSRKWAIQASTSFFLFLFCVTYRGAFFPMCPQKMKARQGRPRVKGEAGAAFQPPNARSQSLFLFLLLLPFYPPPLLAVTDWGFDGREGGESDHDNNALLIPQPPAGGRRRRRLLSPQEEEDGGGKGEASNA